MVDYLIETALLTHGLHSISNHEIEILRHLHTARFVWLEAGKIITGTLQEYLPFRERGEKLPRFDAKNLLEAEIRKLSGALTASATMLICSRWGIPVTVTCGMGGIGPYPDLKIGADLITLSELPVILVASAPKDVFDLPATISWLKKTGVKVVGNNDSYCDGFLTKKESVQLDGTLAEVSLEPKLLILNRLPDKERVVRPEQLAEAMDNGIQVQQHGGYYHPAVNNRLDELTAGMTSRIQLRALQANVFLVTNMKIHGYIPDQEGK
jgi:pseudouridylate synthase